jgi:hypothetical protein
VQPPIPPAKISRVAEAIFGLVGVVVGAVITEGAEYYLKRRKEKADVRQAARLAQAEFARIDWWVRHVRDELGTLPPEDLRMPELNRHLALFARHLSREEWEALYAGYQVVDEIQLLASTLAETGSSGGEMRMSQSRPQARPGCQGRTRSQSRNGG